MDSTDTSTGTGRRSIRIVFSLERWRWLPEVFVAAPVLRFSDGGRRVLAEAQEQARALSHDYIGTEHLLLSALADGQSAAVSVLQSLGLDAVAVRQQVEEIIGTGRRAPGAVIPYTPRTKRVLDLSRREALWLGDREAGEQHVLLGLIAEGEGVAAQVLVRVDATLGRVRQQLVLTGEDAELLVATPDDLSPDAMRWQPDPCYWRVIPFLRQRRISAGMGAQARQGQYGGANLITHGWARIDEVPGRHT